MALTEEGILHVPNLMSRWVRLSNGAKAHYVTAGDTGPTVILLHGGASGSSGTAVWGAMAVFLGASGFRIYCPDLPGFGLADIREEHLPLKGTISQVEFVNEFADALSLDKFHLAGNSMGCTAAALFVTMFPERVISFALVAGTVGDLIDPERRVSSTIQFPVFDGTEESIRHHLETVLYRKEAVVDDLVRMRTLAGNRQKGVTLAIQAGREQLVSDLKLQQKASLKGRIEKLTTPGIYLHGKQDLMIPVVNGYMQEDELPNVQFFYPDACGHLGHADQPEMFHQVFLEFFRDGRISRETADWAGVSDRRPELLALVEQTVSVSR